MLFVVMDSCAVSLGILFLSLFREGSASSYQWRCSTLDTTNNKYYLPDFGGRTEVMGYTWEESNDSYSYIYEVNNDELDCNGTVTAVEFCYNPPQNNQPGNRQVFTLLILTQEDNGARVTNSIPISFDPDSAECSGSKCCDIMTLMEQDQFSLPSPNFFLGMTTTTRDRPNLPGLQFGTYPRFQPPSSYRLVDGQTMVNNIKQLNSPLVQTLRLMWLHITPFPGTTQSTAASSTSTDQPAGNSNNNTTVSDNITTSTDQPAGNSNNNTSTVGAVVGVLVLLIVIISSILLVLMMLIIYRKKKYYSSKDVGATAIDNIIYDDIGTESTLTMKDSALNNPEYDYSELGPGTAAGEMGPESTKQENLYYAPVLSTNNTIPQEYEDFQSQSNNFSSQQTSDYDEIYTAPANNVVGLYEQLENMMTDDVTRHNIVLGDLLGSGQFGDVYEGVWERRLDNLDVAVKTLKEGSSEEDKVKFLQEAAIMAQFRHPNVVTMYGVVKDGEPVLLVLEMLKKGDLRNYLLSTKTDDGGVSSEIDGHELLSYCRQVVSGMVYLSNKAFVHRDLAARNILVSDDRICKIADFGMSRDLADENYYVSNGGKIPVKWTAPEAIFYKKYSTASDVWSFGAVLYEIWSIGCKPFQNMQNTQIIEMLNSGSRLPPPPGCPRAIYSIMISCWHPEPKERPSFDELSTKLSVSNSKLLQKDEADTCSGATLGADLSHGEGMYKDLQKMYISQQ